MSGTVVTVGTFDGMHRGHAAVLARVAARARASGRESLLVTFEPHPLDVVNPAAAPPRLTTADERLEVVATCPVDRMAVLRFDRAMSLRSPEEFIDQVLVGQFGLRELVIGHDHGFGRGRRGDVETVRRLGLERGFPVEVVGAVGAGGHAVSSTAIRRAVAGGDLEGAAQQLGRRYTLQGVVVRGERRGRLLGVPTINLDAPPRKLLPPDGVYAVIAETPHGRFGGMMNQGHRPTFADGRRLLEVHLLGTTVDLYDRVVRVTWIRHLRDIRRFDGIDALVGQLTQDRLDAAAALAAVQVDLDAPLPAPE